MRGLNHHGTDSKFLRNSLVRSGALQSKGEAALSVLASSIFDRDEAIATLLGGDYMPGCTAEAFAYQNVRVRSLPHSSSRYRLTRNSAMSSTGSLTAHLKSPSIASKGNSRYDDSSLTPLVDEIDINRGDIPSGNLQLLTSKRLIASINLLEELCALDKVLSFHLFLASSEKAPERSEGGVGKKINEKNMRNQSTTSTRDHVKLTPYVLSMIFDEIAVNLPNPDMRRITPLKCLYVISNQSNTKGSNNTAAIDFGILIIELFQKDDVFLDFKISKLTKGCGQLSALLKIVVKSFFLTLKLCGVRAVKVKNDLSLSSISHNVNTFQRKIIESYMSTGRSMVLLNSRRDSNLALLMCELVETKMALGFQLVGKNNFSLPQFHRGNNGIIQNEESLPLDNESDQRNQTLVAHLHAVSSTSPTGMEIESLLQCELTFLSNIKVTLIFARMMNYCLIITYHMFFC